MGLLRKFPGLLLLLSLYGSAQQNKITQRIFLVGDAGETQNGIHPVCDWLKSHVDWNDSSNTLVYLGDNIYPEGMPDAGKKYEEAKAIIDYQLSVVKDKMAKAFFVPGNHDWKKGKPGGWEQIKNEEYYINSLEWPNVQALPMNGCPGPVPYVLNDQVVLVFMDSQWWLQKGEKPGIESDCDYKTEDEVIMALKDILGTYPDKLVITLMHHPLYTHGHHGGYFTVKQHIFPLTDISPSLYIPLPVIGSIYPVTRAWFGNIQDVKHPQYKNFIARVEDALKQHPSVIDAAGHDHNLQLLQHDSITYIVSGAGSKKVQVKKGKNSLFAESKLGFAVIEVSADGKVDVKFYTVNDSKDLAEPVYSLSVKPVPPPQKEIATNEKISFPDSMTIVGSTTLQAGGLKKLLMGKNYRKEWAQPIRVPVIDLSKELGGLTPIKRGGGHQTKSLRLEDSTGRQYVLRAVTKNVTDAALPPDLRGTFAKDVISDGVSASYPYAALSVPAFATASGVPHANPRLVYVSDDPNLGKFRKDYANKAYLLEEREPDGFKKGMSTDEMADQLRKDNDNSVDEQQFLNARLLDMFIMDFDRHEDQWQWADVEKGGGKKFQALPRDRDQPFFISEGILASIARQNWLAPQIQGFLPHARNIKTFNFNARNMDHTFLNEPDEKDWKKAIDEFLPKMTDDLFENALDQQPTEIKNLPAKDQIIATLKKRRKYFAEEMMTYYRFISKIVSIPGSDKREQFEINRNNDGSVKIEVRKINKEGEVKNKIYERTFDPSITKEIRLYGRGGDDNFIMKGNSSKIKIRIIGGSGNDVYESDATSRSGKTLVYDLDDSTENNTFTGNDDFRKKLSTHAAVNDYEWKNFKYNTHRPMLAVTYNPDDGVYLGASMRFTRQGFRKSPYAQMQQFTVTHALATKAYSFKYLGEFVNAIGNTDLIINAIVKAPNNTTNFFSYGNESVYNKEQPEKIRYYRARYQVGSFGITFKHKLGSTFSVLWGPVFEYFKFDSSDNINRFILMTPANGLDPSTLAKNKSWTGGQLTVSLDDRDNKLMPTRGIHWETTLKVLSGMNDYSHSLSQLNSEMSLYTSFSKNAGFVLATRFGAGINFNNNFEFFQAQYLGSMEGLRGYRRYRFAGKAMAYNNVEMRIKVADFRTYLFPGSIGLLFFNDVGRVWVKNDTSSIWHDGYGAGIWFSPLHRLAITASAAFSKEGTLPLVTLGWQF
jgi:hypothetical protein